jgi:hypothetical protein
LGEGQLLGWMTVNLVDDGVDYPTVLLFGDMGRHCDCDADAASHHVLRGFLISRFKVVMLLTMQHGPL